jgi:flagellar hook protein FlgE
MASTTALYTGLSGLTVNARNLDVIGNNIANANTTAYKSSRMLFATQFSRSLSQGSVPSNFIGGTNPSQVGLGAIVAGTQRNFSPGSLSVTGDQRDLAIDGQGFFIVNRGSTPLYTRAGAFRQNSVNELVTVTGERLQGYGVDSQFNIDRSALVDLKIPMGTLTVAEATTEARFTGQLNAAGALPVHGSQTTLNQIFLRAGASGTLDGTTLLTDVSDTSGGASIYQAGQTLKLTGARKGTQVIADQNFAINAGTTVNDLMTFFTQALGINPAAGRNPDGTLPGVTIDPTGVISIDGNAGVANTIDLAPGNFKLLSAGGSTANDRAFTPTLNRPSDGESVRTRFIVYDSLGGPVNVDLTAQLVQAVGGQGTIWRWYAESGDNTSGNGTALGTGLIEFDENGKIKDPGAFQISVDRTGTGAATPLSLDIDFKSALGSVTAFKNPSASGTSTLLMAFQDGAPAGTLQSYTVGNDGIITGSFSNGRARTLGQVAIATFANQEGLSEVGSNLFTLASNSGVPIISQPLELGAGKIVGGSLELSNTELSQEFINLILASTGFSAASRVITTTDQLMQQLLALGR